MNWNVSNKKAKCTENYNFTYIYTDSEGFNEGESIIAKTDIVDIVLMQNINNPDFKIYRLEPNQNQRDENCEIYEDEFKIYFELI